MAEEHGFQSSETHRLCVNNCGFFGSPATNNLCSKCYGELGVKKSADSPLFSSPLPASPASSATAATRSIAPAVPSHEMDQAVAAAELTEPQQPRNRCSSCRKKVGLTGFKCRCGATFCGTHRYPEKHDCGFDFKATGREAIAKANPLIKADKLEKI